jgi:hypothetical protein
VIDRLELLSSENHTSQIRQQTTRQSYARTPTAAGLLDSSDGASSRHNDEQLGQAGTYEEEPQQNEDLKPPTTHQQTKHTVSFASRHKG